MEVTVIIEKTSTGYSAYAQDVDGIVTAAINIGELKCYVGELKEDQVAYLREMDQSVKADKLKSAKINYHIDLSSFFEEFEAIDLQGFAKYIGIEEKYFYHL